MQRSTKCPGQYGGHTSKMVMFLVDNLGYREKKLIKKFIRKHRIEKYLIYSLSKNDVRKGAKYLNINEKFFKIQDVGFDLLDQGKEEIEKTAKTLSNIIGLDLTIFTKRLLLNKVFYKRARFLVGEEMLLKQEQIERVVILNKYKDTLADKGNVIHYSDNLHIILLSKAIFRYVTRLFLLLLKRLTNLKKNSDLIKSKKYDIIAVQTTPLSYQLVEKTLRLLKSKYAIAVTPGFCCDKEQISFKVQRNIDKIKICPTVVISDFLELINFLHLLRLRKYKWEIIGIFDNILFRKKTCEYVAKKLKPKVILVKNEYDLFENIEYNVFEKYGIKYIDYVHGEKFYSIRDAFLEYHKMAVWGKRYKRLFEEKLRTKTEMIEVIGNQLFDEVPSYHAEDKSLLELKNKYKKIISVFTEPSYWLCDTESQSIMIRKIVDFVKENKNVYMILKHHHLEFKYPTPAYNLLIKSIKDRVLECTTEIRLYDILSVSDLIVTCVSTVGLEGILFKKPVLYMNFGGTSRLLEYPKVNAAVEINNPENSEFYLNKMLFDKNFVNNLCYEKVIEGWANGLDGNSHIRFDKLIEEQIS